MRRKCLLAALLLALSFEAAAQRTPLAFDVASVKANDSGERASSTLSPPGGRFSAKNASLKLLIRMAYRLSDYQVSGGPDWIRFDRFDVLSKVRRESFAEFDFALPATIMPSPDSTVSIFEAIQDQLGLRLEQTKGPVEFLMIDHADRPSPD